MTAPRLAMGLMSGTSADGIDAVLLSVPASGAMQVRGHFFHPYPDALRSALLDFGSEDHRISARDLAGLDGRVGLLYAEAAQGLLASTPDAVQAEVIGMHGQTVCHTPPDNSMQIGNPAPLLAALRRPVVTDFRRADMAFGGQGAPLAPLFHQAAFGAASNWRVVVNLGGIANITWLPPTAGGNIQGFDTGPANGLMDAWYTRHHDAPGYDRDGEWARTGQVLPGVLEGWLQDPFYQLSPPKSTGRGDFNLERLFALAPPGETTKPADIQRTLLELTVRTIAEAIERQDRIPEKVLLCGGGAYNTALVLRLAERLAPARVARTDEAGIAPEHVEAAAMAWLALRRVDQLPGAASAVTGARCDAVSGALYAPTP